MSNRKMKILHYIPAYNFGGIESFTYALNKKLKDKCEFVYLVERDLDIDTKRKLEQLDARIIRIPNMTKETFFGHISAVRNLFKNERFDIVHVHNCAARIFVMWMAKKMKVERRIYHIHSKNIDGRVFSKMLNRLGLRVNISLANLCLSCSEEAAKAKKIKKYLLVKNCIDVEQYKFNYESRKNIRCKYGIFDDDILLLFVGRIEKIKNLDFLVKVVSRANKNNSKSVKILFIGSGSEMGNLKDLAGRIAEGNAIFIASCDDISSYYSAGDFFCMSSFSEGFPIALLEAQANGLDCIVSKNIPSVTKVSCHFYRLGIDCRDIGKWVKAILTTTRVPLDKRNNVANDILKSGYDSSSCARNIFDIYRGSYGK